MASGHLPSLLQAGAEYGKLGKEGYLRLEAESK